MKNFKAMQPLRPTPIIRPEGYVLRSHQDRGKQYSVTEGQTLLIERLPDDVGATVELEPLLLAGDGAPVFEGDGLASAVVQAEIVAHERGPKLRVFKFKPKRGYKRRTGHRQELTRIRITSIGANERS